MGQSLRTLLIEVLPLALGAAASPALLVLTILLLSGRERSRARAAAFAAGTVAVLAAVSALVLTISVPFAEIGAHADRSAVLDLVFGSALALMGLRALVKRRNRHSAPVTSVPTEPSTGPGHLFVLGLGAMATNATTLALYIPAMKDVAAARLGSVDSGLAVLIILLIASLPATLPVLADATAPRYVGRLLTRIRGSRLERSLLDRKEVVTAIVCLAAAAYLLLRGAVRL